MKKVLVVIFGIILGGGAGYSFYYSQYVSTGACPVPGSPWTNPYFLTIGGAIFGALFFDGIVSQFRKRQR